MSSDADTSKNHGGRFEKGRSGNVKGRPRKAKTVGATISDAFAERIHVSEGGRRSKITKLDAAAKQLANKSASGDTRALKLGLELARKAEEQQSRSHAAPAQLSENDENIARRFIARLQQAQKELDQ